MMFLLICNTYRNKFNNNQWQRVAPSNDNLALLIFMRFFSLRRQSACVASLSATNYRAKVSGNDAPTLQYCGDVRTGDRIVLIRWIWSPTDLIIWQNNEVFVVEKQSNHRTYVKIWKCVRLRSVAARVVCMQCKCMSDERVYECALRFSCHLLSSRIPSVVVCIFLNIAIDKYW